MNIAEKIKYSKGDWFANRYNDYFLNSLDDLKEGYEVGIDWEVIGGLHDESRIVLFEDGEYWIWNKPEGYVEGDRKTFTDTTRVEVLSEIRKMCLRCIAEEQQDNRDKIYRSVVYGSLRPFPINSGKLTIESEEVGGKVVIDI